MRDGIYSSFKYIETPIIADPNIPAVTKGKKEILAEINRGFSLISENELKKIEVKWTGKPILQSIPWNYVIGILLAIFLIFGFMFLWNMQLRKRVAIATGNLAILNESLQESNSHLQRLDEAKSHFIAIASHELRTPLTSLKGLLSMFIEKDF